MGEFLDEFGLYALDIGPTCYWIVEEEHEVPDGRQCVDHAVPVQIHQADVGRLQVHARLVLVPYEPPLDEAPLKAQRKVPSLALHQQIGPAIAVHVTELN